MVEALWSVVFVSGTQQFGAGVAVLETGRILGGDAQYYYVGSYKVQGGDVIATVKVTHFAGPAQSIFGPSESHEITLRGTARHDTFVLTGAVTGSPSHIIAIELTRRAELP